MVRNERRFVKPLRLLVLALGASAVLSCAASANAASLGNVDVNFDGSTWSVTPSSLSGAVGDTFVLRNLRNNSNNNGVSYIALVDGTGQGAVGGVACTTDASCRVNDTFAAPGSPLSATVTVGTGGTFAIRRTTDSGESYISVGTLTVTAGGNTPDPGPVTQSSTVAAVTPNSGLSTGGESVTITGTGFSTTATPAVTFGGTAATNVQVATATTLTATTPAHAVGAVDVAVTNGSDTATLASGYTYRQGYWLTVQTTRPASIGLHLSSIGAVRTPAFGNWATSSVEPRQTNRRVRSSYSDYAGGINCGDRTTKATYLLTLGVIPYSNTWAGGPCKYAFPAGTSVAVAGLPSADLVQLVPGLTIRDDLGFVGAWRKDCAGATTSTCTVTMDADRTAGLAWGYASYWFARIMADVVYPTFGSDGALQYYDAVVIAMVPPTVTGGTGTYLFIAQTPVASLSNERTSHAAAGKVVCRTTARVTGREFRARCKVSPVLAAALRSGPVRLTTKWSVRLPHAEAQKTLRTGHITVSSRHAVVTG